MTRADAETHAKALRLSPLMRYALRNMLFCEQHMKEGKAYGPYFAWRGRTSRALARRKLAVPKNGHWYGTSDALTPAGRELAAGLAGETGEREA